MRANKTTTATDRTYTLKQPTPNPRAAAARLLAAVWCRAVGTSWTLELHQLDGGTTYGKVVDWISSGIPISEPEPDAALARKLLTTRGLHLFGDPSAGPGTHTRRGIGYVCEDAELITLIHLVANDAAKAGVHPVLLAMQWVAAGFSTHDTARWIRQGVQTPQAAQDQTVPPGAHRVTDRHDRPQCR